MSRKFLVNIDLNKNELQNAVIQNLGTAPSSPVAGQIYYNTTDNTLYFWTGSAWVNVVQAAEIAYGTLASRPAAGTAGRLYYATDNYLLYFDDGATWTQVDNFGTVTAQTSYGATSSNGTSTNFARADHTHGTPSLSTNVASNITATTATNGTGTAPAKDDHVHGFTPSNFAISSFGQATGNVNLNSNKITNLATPTAGTDAANKDYVDGVAQGLDVKASVVAATTTAGTLASSFANGSVIDGVTLATGDRILIKNQATGSENGIYTVNATGAPTRATDMDTGTEFPGAFTFVEQGTVNADTGWVCTNNSPVTVGTTAITFAQFSGAGTYTASNGITLTGSNFTFNPTSTGGLQTAAGGASILKPTNSGLVTDATGLYVGAGTGITVSGTNVAIDTSVVVRKYAANVGDGTSTAITVTHNLNTRDIQVTVYDNSSPYAEVVCDVEHTTTTTATLRFSVAPTSNQYRVVVFA